MTAGARFCLTVDVEDWPQSTWDRSLPITERAVRNTEAMLALLADRGVGATFFVLGKLAATFPAVARSIHAAGYEVGCHGYGHVEIFKQDRAAFREDVRRAKALLEDQIGAPVRGFRAPDFSIRRDSLWALEVLAEAGFAYDSSIFPIDRGRYGIGDWPLGPLRVTTGSGALIEIPLAAVRLAGRRWPVAGGGYARLLPGSVLRAAVARVLAAGRDFIFYGHPYELDPDELSSLDLALPWKTRLHQGLGRRHFHRKLLDLLNLYGSCSMQSIIDGGGPLDTVTV